MAMTNEASMACFSETYDALIVLSLPLDNEVGMFGVLLVAGGEEGSRLTLRCSGDIETEVLND